MDDDALADTQTDTDLELALRIACGEDEALREFLGRHGGRVCNYLRKNFPGLIDDAFQEMLMRLINSANHFDPAKGTLSVWCISIAHNCAVDLLKAGPPEAAGEIYPEICLDRRHGVPAKGDEDEQKVDAKQEKRRERTRRQMQEAIETLSSTEQLVVKADLAHLSDDREEKWVAPARALAEKAGTTIGAIHTARSRGRKKLREELTRRGVYHGEG